MSQADVEVIARGFGAFDRGDRDALLELFHPEITWYPSLALMLDQDVYTGPEEVCRLVLDEIPEVLQGFHSEVEAIEDLGGGAVLVVVVFGGRAASAGMDIEQRFFQVHRVRDGKPVEMRAYPSRAEAVAAAGA